MRGISMAKIIGNITLYLFLIVCVAWFMDYKMVQEYYYPIVSNNEQLKEELGSILKVHKSLFETEDENYNLRVQVTTENNLKYLVKINSQDSQYYEILEDYNDKD